MCVRRSTHFRCSGFSHRVSTKLSPVAAAWVHVGLSQRASAELLGVSPRTLQDRVQGRAEFYLREGDSAPAWMMLSTKSRTSFNTSSSILPMRPERALSMVAIFAVRMTEGAGSPTSA